MSLATQISALATAIGTAVKARVRVDTASQGLTTTEQGNARTNIDAVGKGELAVSVLDKGAKGDNTTDDSAAFQSAINSAATLGLIVHIPAGTYRLASTVDLPSGTAIRAAQGATIDLTALGNANPAFRALGTAATGVSLTGDAAEGATTVTVSSATGLAAGDYVKVSSTTVASSITSQQIGEIQRVRSVAGNVLTFADPLSRTYTTAASAVVAKLTQKQNIRIEGLTFRGVAANTTTTYQAVTIDTARNVTIRDCAFRWCHYTSIVLADAISVRVSDCHFEDALNTGLAYGVAIWWASQDVSVVSCTSLRVRHQVTCGGGTSRPGTPRRVTVSACVATESIDAGFDAHSGCDWFTVTGCHVIGGEQDGIIAQGRHATLVGNTVTGVARHGIFVQGNSIGGLEAVVSSNDITRPGGRGIYVLPDSTTAHQVWNGVAITGNHVSLAGTVGIEVAQSATTFYADGFTITGNTVRQSAQHGMLIRGVRDVAVDSNHVYQAAATYSCIYFLNSVDCVAVGNVVNGNSVSASGIRFGTTATNCIASSNRVRGCTTGFLQDSGSGPGAFLGNLAAGCTTGYSLSGTGNVNANNL